VEHDAEMGDPLSESDHAQTKSWTMIRYNPIGSASRHGTVPVEHSWRKPSPAHAGAVLTRATIGREGRSHRLRHLRLWMGQVSYSGATLNRDIKAWR
jgi:hypothetical protein